MSARGLCHWSIAFALGCALAGCELVADFDRDKIPEPPRDAAVFDADIDFPDAAPDDDGGTTPEPTTPGDEDAGR